VSVYAVLGKDLVGEDGQMRDIGILLFEDVEELDAIGPWEVLSYWCNRFPEDGWAVHTLSRDGGVVHCAKGLDVVARHSFADAPPAEVLIHPGGRGTQPQLTDEDHLAWVREQRAKVPLMASVCTGSMVYAAAGLLTNRPATSYWAALDELAALDPSIEIRPDDRFVDDGDVLTSAGISAGIDMALHIVARFAGADRARTVRRGIQYDPQPPV
jgi:transcriptional regulator GlxA family with amidase domain